MKTIDLVRWAESSSNAEKLWGLVLLLAVKDSATKVCFDPTRGDKALTYEISDTEYDMVPPPEEAREEILQVAESMVRPRSAWRALTNWWNAASSPRTQAEEVVAVAVGPERFALRVTVDRATPSVMMQLRPDQRAAFGAKDALEKTIDRHDPDPSVRE